MFRLQDKKEFPKKLFEVEGKSKYYTPVLHFFKSERIIDKLPKRVEFTCKLCEKKLSPVWPNFTNLNKHLKLYCKKAKTW